MDPCVKDANAALGGAEDAILAIECPDGDRIRSRKVISRSKARGSGKYPSWKMGRMIHWESPHELNAFRLLDANSAVLEFAEQPLVIKYRLDGVEHEHYPDIRVTTRQGKELWEVKTAEDAATPEVARRTALMSAALPTLGYVYRVVHAEDLGCRPRLKTVLEVLRLGRADIPAVERERLRVTFERAPNLTWGDVKRGALGAKGQYFACRLILEGAIALDLTTPILDSRPLTWRGQQADFSNPAESNQ